MLTQWKKRLNWWKKIYIFSSWNSGRKALELAEKAYEPWLKKRDLQTKSLVQAYFHFLTNRAGIAEAPYPPLWGTLNANHVHYYFHSLLNCPQILLKYVKETGALPSWEVLQALPPEPYPRQPPSLNDFFEMMWLLLPFHKTIKMQFLEAFLLAQRPGNDCPDPQFFPLAPFVPVRGAMAEAVASFLLKSAENCEKRLDGEASEKYKWRYCIICLYRVIPKNTSLYTEALVKRIRFLYQESFAADGSAYQAYQGVKSLIHKYRTHDAELKLTGIRLVPKEFEAWSDAAKQEKLKKRARQVIQAPQRVSLTKRPRNQEDTQHLAG